MAALDGIRVLDFGRYVAGPWCATMLADFGADVIRVDRIGGSEDRWLTPVTDDEQGALFLQINRNKRSLTLDTRKDEGREVLRRLVRQTDVVVANVPVSALAGMGIDYATLCADKPDVILANVSSFGPRGPWTDRPGFDSVGQAMCGSAYLSGPGDHPYRTPITWVDHASALYCAFGVMAALRERDHTGRGQQIDASLLGSGLAVAGTYLVEQAIAGTNRQAIGNRSFVNGPTDTFRTQDGWVVTQVVGDPIFRRWTRLMQEPHWLEDPRFATDELRGANGAVLSERMGAWCAMRSNDEALAELAAAGIPAGPVLSPQEAIEHEQVSAMDFLQPCPVPGLPEPAPLMRLPLDMSVSQPAITRAPPGIGEHNHEILATLGYSAAEIAGLEAARAV
ncbi:MAG: CoA transferase [Sphingomonadales bacterium]|nr:CoA transferase [Sphingomonadales bacterium]